MSLNTGATPKKKMHCDKRSRCIDKNQCCCEDSALIELQHVAVLLFRKYLVAKRQYVGEQLHCRLDAFTEKVCAAGISSAVSAVVCETIEMHVLPTMVVDYIGKGRKELDEFIDGVCRAGDKIDNVDEARSSNMFLRSFSSLRHSHARERTCMWHLGHSLG